MPEITFEFEIGDVVMTKPVVGSNTSYDVEVFDYKKQMLVDQWRITQRRYVEEINGAGKIQYTGKNVVNTDKNSSFDEGSIIRVDDYLAKKAVIDSNKPKQPHPALMRATPTASTLQPGINQVYQSLYESALNAKAGDYKSFAEIIKSDLKLDSPN
jgi:hypothetical protein